MLQRDHPSPSFGEADPNTLRPPGAGKTVDPEALGHDMPEGTMGDNNLASREGPQAQGLGRVISARDEVMDDTGSHSTRGTRTPHGTVEDPAEGGASVMDSPSQGNLGEQAIRSREGDGHVDQRRASRKSKQVTPAPSFIPESSSRNELLHGSYNASTIAASNFEGVVEDRIRQVAEPGQQESFRDPVSLAHKMMRGQLVRFKSQTEKAAVEENAKQIAERMTKNYVRSKKLSQDEVQPSPLSHGFAPVPENVRKAMVERLVAGKYDTDGTLQGKEKHKQPVLNEIAKMAMKNGTFLGSDGDRFLRKVQSLLPAVQSGQQRGGQQKPKAKQV